MDISLTMHGAAGEVTGSASVLEIRGLRTSAANRSHRVRLLIDCGLFQGSAADEARNLEPLSFDAREIDGCVVTHAHVDHCGRLPLLVRDGYRGPIVVTGPTAELLPPVLQGSARVQKVRYYERINAAQKAGRGLRSRGGGKSIIEFEEEDDTNPGESIAAVPPAYTLAEVGRTLPLITPMAYGVPFSPVPGDDRIRARLLDASHVIGSAMVELTIGQGDEQVVVVFSGDLGSSVAPLLPAVRPPVRADVLIMESTYGSRAHPKPAQTLAQLGEIIQMARRGRQRLLVPTFTLGRAQQLLYRLSELSHQGLLGGFPVYLDSKMAIRATEIYARHPEHLCDESARIIRAGRSPLQFDELHYITNRPESKRLNDLRHGGMIIAGAGFCHGGPIVHHLISGLPRTDCRVLMIGHQPADTPGHAIAGGARQVVLNGEKVPVEATIHTMHGFSGHADRKDLLNFVGDIRSKPATVVLNHGDDAARATLAEKLTGMGIGRVAVPGPRDAVDVLAGA
ncbi:MAG: MBL fold metallo-hydrolase RNA specificity domain-containing protein [bacterium]|jgi:metallo-beta-lactamase family protein|nr:MBL fold metallo-hydrolase [Planctomycetaceae bacterium]